MNNTAIALTGLAFAAASLAAAGPASAQPRVEQTGDGYSIAYEGAAERGGVAGGRAARLLGGGDDGTVLYTGPDPALGGRSATLSGGGDNAVLTYAEPAPAAASASLMAGGAAGAAGPRG